MADLRALLGDKYGVMIVKAANAICGGRHGGRVTRFSRAQLNALDVRDAEAALAAVLPDLLADAWDEAVASMRYEDGTPVQLVSVVNPYRPETATGRPEPAPGSEPHNTEGA